RIVARVADREILSHGQLEVSAAQAHDHGAVDGGGPDDPVVDLLPNHVDDRIAALVRRLRQALVTPRPERDRVGPFDARVAQPRQRRGDDARITLVVVAERERVLPTKLEDAGNTRAGESVEYRPILGER